MFLLIDLGLIFLFSFFFIITYYVIEKIRISKFVFNLKLFLQGKFLIEGLIYGGILTVFYLTIESIYSEFVIPLYLAFPIVLALIRNIYVGLISGAPLLIYHTISNYYDPRILYSIIGSYLLFVIMQIVIFYFDNFYAKFTLLSIWSMLMFVFMIIYEYLTTGGLTSYSIEVLVGPPIASIILFLTLTWVLQFLESANILSEAVSFNFSRYYRQSLKQTAIGKFITTNKTEKAIYGIFEFDFPVQDTNDKNIEIRESILLDFEKQMPLNAILFRADLNRYGFFIPVFTKVKMKQLISGNSKFNRDFDDPLKSIETTIKNRNITYMTSWDSEVKINMKAGVIMYGIQEQSVDKMLNLAEIALTQHENEKHANYVQVYDSKRHLTKLDESIQISNMDKKINLDRYNCVFLPAYSPKINSTSIVLSIMEKVDEVQNDESLIEYLEFFGWTEYFDRYGAWLAINKYRGEYPLAIHYSPRILSHNFDINYFEAKVQKNNINLKNLILVFNLKILNEVKGNATFISNINALQKQGVTFAITQISDAIFSADLPSFKYIFASKNEKNAAEKLVQKGLQTNIIYYEINDEKDIENINFKSSNYLLAGEYIGKNITFVDIDKKTISNIKSTITTHLK